jgi:hypothetical protein
VGLFRTRLSRAALILVLAWFVLAACFVLSGRAKAASWADCVGVDGHFQSR